MKKILVFVSVFALVFFAVFGIVSCGGTPAPVEEAPVPPPPPPPPPPSPPPAAATTAKPTVGPEIQINFTPEMFSPDGDGENDELEVSITINHSAEIYGWAIEIREPEPPYLLFSEWSGRGAPPEKITWDGRSATGERVQSASEYHFALTVNDIYDNVSVYQGSIQVDVLVHREPGGVLRIIVPSIVFPPNANVFTGLDDRRMRNNDRILRRIAEVLNKFDTYKVTVEGHANPTTPPNTTARTNEENGTRTVKGLKPLSEERARAVVAYLENLGVAKGRLTAVGMGGTRTVVDFADRDNWWKNRRVEFILIK